MQRITYILGSPTEGKTNELIEDYIRYFLSPVMCSDGQVRNAREMVKPIFIVAGDDTHNPIPDYIKKLEGSDELLLSMVPIERKVDALNDLNSYEHFHTAVDSNVLKDLVHEHLSVSDCIFFIDNVDTIMTSDELIELSNSYPRLYVGQSADFVVTMTKK